MMAVGLMIHSRESHDLKKGSRIGRLKDGDSQMLLIYLLDHAYHTLEVDRIGDRNHIALVEIWR